MAVSDFFAFARERHSIYLRRKANAPISGHEKMPWTRDVILGTYRFTNVFRELDRTTVWFREHVREPYVYKIEAQNVLLATVVFRWFNRITTGEAVFSQPALGLGGELEGETAFDTLVRTGDVDPLRAVVLQYCGDGPYVTGAYIIKTPDGLNKLDGVLQCIQWFMEQAHPPVLHVEAPFEPASVNWGQMAESLSRLQGKIPLETVWDWLRQFPYLGDFMAYEIVTDLRWTALLDRAPDIMTWANPGPGATRGAGRVLGGDKNRWDQHRDKDRVIDVMRDILAASLDPSNWPQYFDDDGVYVTQDYILDVPRPTDAREIPERWPRWEMRDVEHTLCEFDKYERVRTGEGRPRGRFR